MFTSWSASYFGYNSYAYAIGRTDEINPGISVWISAGYDREDYIYDCCASMQTIIGWIESDLEYFGSTVNTVATTNPNTIVDAHTYLICFRKDIDGMPWYFDEEGYLQYYHELYFMRLDRNGKWYHKPTESLPFQYKYTPTNSRTWVYEAYDGDVCIRDEDWTHEGEIYYIEYTTPHVYTYRTCGGDKHINTCTICGGTTGSAMACVFVNDKCKICGYIKIESGGLRTPIVPVEDVAA